MFNNNTDNTPYNIPINYNTSTTNNIIIIIISLICISLAFFLNIY